jgi:hypothetical protein
VKIKDKIAVYVVHPGKDRSEEGDDKFNLDRADKAFLWIEKEFARFLDELAPDDSWNPRLAEPDGHNPDSDGDVPGACTHPGYISLINPNQSHTSHIEV